MDGMVRSAAQRENGVWLERHKRERERERERERQRERGRD